MWTEQERIQHAPRDAPYPSDVTDEEWRSLRHSSLLPRSGGRRRDTDMREVMNAARHVLCTGCQWRHAITSGFCDHQSDKFTEALKGIRRRTLSSSVAVLCQEDVRASCCTRDEGRPFGVAL